jgi:hypothetical protein
MIFFHIELQVMFPGKHVTRGPRVIILPTYQALGQWLHCKTMSENPDLQTAWGLLSANPYSSYDFSSCSLGPVLGCCFSHSAPLLWAGSFTGHRESSATQSVLLSTRHTAWAPLHGPENSNSNGDGDDNKENKFTEVNWEKTQLVRHRCYNGC